MPIAMKIYCKNSEAYFRNSLDKIEKLRPKEESEVVDDRVDSSPSIEEIVTPASPSQSDSEDTTKPQIYTGNDG